MATELTNDTPGLSERMRVFKYGTQKLRNTNAWSIQNWHQQGFTDISISVIADIEKNIYNIYTYMLYCMYIYM